MFERFLGQRHVEVNAGTCELAQKVVGRASDVVGQARTSYDRVVGYMTYDANQQSWTGSTGHGLVCSVGNGNDLHALLISRCRSAGIPSRLVMGQALETPEPGEEQCELCGYHCWAEFFAPEG